MNPYKIPHLHNCLNDFFPFLQEMIRLLLQGFYVLFHSYVPYLPYLAWLHHLLQGNHIRTSMQSLNKSVLIAWILSQNAGQIQDQILVSIHLLLVRSEILIKYRSLDQLF